VNHVSAFFENSKGLSLHYQYWEDSSKSYQKVAILLHAAGYHSGSYPYLVPALVAARYKVYCFDFEGFGKSAGTRGGGNFVRFVDDLESFRRVVKGFEGLREIMLIGHSIGALVALNYLEKYADVEIRAVLHAPCLATVPDSVAASQFSDDTAWMDRLAADPQVQPSFDKALVEAASAYAKGAAERAPVGFAGRKILVEVGEADNVADLMACRNFYDALECKEKEFVSFPRAGHDCWVSKYKDDAIKAIVDWLDKTAFQYKAP
jgi:alpha-beta hydrolase superfamily lysophospholipase